MTDGIYGDFGIEGAPTPQTISLDDDRTCAVFVDTEDGETRVFYDLNALVSQIQGTIIIGSLRAKLTGDEKETAYYAGAAQMLVTIMDSANHLRGTRTVADAVETLDGVETIEDMFPED